MLKYRRLGLLGFNALARFMARMGVGKMRVNGKRLRDIIYPMVENVVHFGLPETIEVNGMSMHLTASNGRGRFAWLYPFDYEPETKRAFEQIVKPGMNIVDAGAHIGYYTLLSAKLLNGTGKVYAFEPDPLHYETLNKNIRTNHLIDFVEVSQQAVAESKRTTTLFLGKSTGTGLFKTSDSTHQTILTDIVSLDEFFSAKGWPSVHLIKLDIEGSEKLAVEGMRTLVKRNPALKLIIELNPSCLEAGTIHPEDLLILLGELGFNHAIALSKEMKRYKIPQEIQSLVGLARNLNYVNLLCEKDSFVSNA